MAVQVTLIGKPDGSRHFSKRQAALPQEEVGTLHATLNDVLMWGQPRGLLEQAREVSAAECHRVGKLSKADGLIKPLVDVVSDFGELALGESPRWQRVDG